ncbi:conserved hypothetical protein [[Clostridium] ultunense Esp]|nr:conserved hypothetical protein [[Clostridium] ultunense Esp]
MPFDGTVLHALAHELNEKLAGGRIGKIYQPLPTDLLLQIRSGGRNEKLLLSANLTYPRLYLTQENFQNPMEPPMFTMLLRKYIEGGIIQRIFQVEMERILIIEIQSRDELGDLHLYRLLFELMGRHSNLLFLDGEKEIVMDAIHHVTPSMSRVRTVLPGRIYELPPSQGKKNPLTITREEFLPLFFPWPEDPEKKLVEALQGISPFVGRGIIAKAASFTPEGLWEAFEETRMHLIHHHYKPVIFSIGGKSDFCVLPLLSPDQKREEFDEVSACLDTYYRIKAKEDLSKQMGQELLQVLHQEKKKNEKKLRKLEETLRESLEAEQYRLWGELLTSFQHEVQEGSSQAFLLNYYEEGSPRIEIPLDPHLSATENAQRYFKLYNKAKRSLPMVKEQIEKTEEEIAYLDQVILQVEQADQRNLGEIREELIREGILKGDKKEAKKKNGKEKGTVVKIDRYRSSEGYMIYVGKNNLQNDTLTTRIARDRDTWLHTKQIPGSHVVISGEGFSEKTLHEAAMLAAYFSKGRNSSSVPVDYTLIRHVRKPNGAKPGFVIYDHQKTLYVTPDEEKVRSIPKET